MILHIIIGSALVRAVNELNIYTLLAQLFFFMYDSSSIKCIATTSS